MIDPIKYLLGKYDMKDESLLKLPLFESNNTCHPKSNTYNNTAYIDSFFTYLSSKLLHDHGFVNGMDFYGSFLAKKSDFRINIVDDIEYLNDSLFFRKNDKVLYELEYIDMDDFNSDTRNYKKKLNVEDDTQETLLLDDITDITEDTCEDTCEISSEKELEIITLDDYANLNGIKNIDILKIDTQGYDDKVIAGAKNLINGNKIKIIQIEIIFSEIYENPLNIYDIEKFLVPNGYKLFGFSNAGSLASHHIFQSDFIYISKDTYREFKKKSDFFNND